MTTKSFKEIAQSILSLAAITFFVYAVSACSGGTGGTSATDNPASTQTEAKLLEPGDIIAINTLVTDWLEAQNKGNFDSYSSLYDPSFSGVKRVGEKATGYNYNAWLADRKRMFGAQMIVRAFDTSFTPSDGKVLVQFTQNWSSGSYRDTGRKVMSVGKTGGTYKIYSEELLNSRILPANVSLDPGVASVIPVHKSSYLILDLENAAIPEGSRNVYVDYEGNAEVLPPEGTVPDKYKNLVGKSFWAAGPDGNIEQVTVESVLILAACIPHFGQVQQWRGGEGQDKPSEQSIADETVEIAGHFWAARFANPRDKRFDFAWPESTPEPAWFEKTTLDDAAEAALIQAFHASDSWLSLKNNYDSNKSAEDPEWPGPDDERYLAYRQDDRFVMLSTASYYLFPNSEAQTVFWSADAGELRALNSLSLPIGDSVLPDFNHNGLPDVVSYSGFGEQTMFVDGEALWSFSIPYYDCPF